MVRGVWWINIKTRLLRWLPAKTGWLVSCAGLDCLPFTGFWDGEASGVAIQGSDTWERIKRQKKEPKPGWDEEPKRINIWRSFHMWMQTVLTRTWPWGQWHSGSRGVLRLDWQRKWVSQQSERSSHHFEDYTVDSTFCKCPRARRWTWQVSVVSLNWQSFELTPLKYDMVECGLNPVWKKQTHF